MYYFVMCFKNRTDPTQNDRFFSGSRRQIPDRSCGGEQAGLSEIENRLLRNLFIPHQVD